MTVISAQTISFAYPKAPKDTLHGLNFHLDKGEIFGFLGPSGSGKTTTQKLLIGLMDGYRGSLQVFGKEMTEWGTEYYERIGVSFKLPNLYTKLTGRENLSFFASLYKGTCRTPLELLELVGLEHNADVSVSHYSKGMKMRLNLVRALIHCPSLLFLYDPSG